MRSLIVTNMAWNAFFILMAASEMIGITQVHEGLPWYLKWWWIIALAGGNLIIHIGELSHCSSCEGVCREDLMKSNLEIVSLRQANAALALECKRGSYGSVQSTNQTPDPSDPIVGADRPG